MRYIVKKIIAAALALLLVWGVCPAVAWAWSLPEFPADARVIIADEQTGNVIYQQGADERAYPASLTKMMTALVALDSVGNKLDEYITVGDELSLVPYDSTVMGLAADDRVTWRNLLYGMLIPSGSDAALVIATHVGREVAGDESLSAEAAIETFVDLMNRKAEEMGLTGTHFANVHGFHDNNHYSCARDLLTLAQAVRAQDLLREICGTASYHCVTAAGREIVVYSTNWLLVETAGDINSEGILLYEGEAGVSNPYYRSQVTGIKTGYTGEAGRCLAFSSTNGELPVIGVVLNMPDQPSMYTTMDAVVEACATNFERRRWESTANPQSITVDNPSLLDRLLHFGKLKMAAAEPLTSTIDVTSTYEERIVYNDAYVVSVSDAENASESVHLVTAVGEGVQVATLQILRDGNVIEEVPLYATASYTPAGNRDIALIIVLVIVGLFVVGALGAAFVHARKRQRQRQIRRRQRGQRYTSERPKGQKRERSPQRRNNTPQPRKASHMKR